MENIDCASRLAGTNKSTRVRRNNFMTTELFGTMLAGSVDTVRPAREAFDRQAVDWDLSDSGVDFAPARQSTIAQPVSVAEAAEFLIKDRVKWRRKARRRAEEDDDDSGLAF